MRPKLSQPKDTQIAVWRYLELSKFISLLDTQKLFLARADLLGDQHEGSITDINLQQLRRRYPRLKKKELLARYAKTLYRLRKTTYISSWHISTQESYAMWKLYSKTVEGVALQTTYQNLANSYSDKRIHIGLVEYINYKSDEIPIDNSYLYFMYKRHFFEYEHEVRLIKQFHKALPDSDYETMPEGIEVEVDLLRLIQRIYINPYAPEWYFKIIQSLLSGYCPFLTGRLAWSSLRNKPLL